MRITSIAVMLVIVAAGWAVDVPVGPRAWAQTPVLSDPGETRRVHLYFAHRQGRHLSSEQRTINREIAADPLKVGRFIIEALIAGPEADGRLMTTVPEGTLLRSFFLEDDGTAYVDLSLATGERHNGGVMHELLCIHAMVNSLVLNMDGAQRVKFLVDGREAATLTGHVDIEDSFSANMLVIR